jgi:hypothetical protein
VSERVIPSLIDVEGNAVLVTGFEEESPGCWKRTYRWVDATGIILEDGSYRPYI